MSLLKNKWAWLAIGLLVIFWWRRNVFARQEKDTGPGAWASVIGGKETVLPNYSGL